MTLLGWLGRKTFTQINKSVLEASAATVTELMDTSFLATDFLKLLWATMFSVSFSKADRMESSWVLQFCCFLLFLADDLTVLLFDVVLGF